MSTPHPETNSPSPSETKPKQAAESIHTYIVSWTWLISGFVGFLVLAGIASSVFFLQTRNIEGNIVVVAQNMIDEAEEKKTQIEVTADIAKKANLARQSHELLVDAANILDNYKRANETTVGVDVLVKLYDILETLYEDTGGNMTPQGQQYGTRLTNLALELVHAATDDISTIKYQTRLLELEWDRRYPQGVIDRGLQLYNVATRINNKDAAYDAMRYIALMLAEHLPIKVYDPREYGLPISATAFSETMDVLLEQLNQLRPEDIDVAKRLAEFIVLVGDTSRPNYALSSSDDLRYNRTNEQRLNAAIGIIDNMVRLNQDDPAAYLTRYHFHTQYVPATGELDHENEDLQTVLRLAPSLAEGLILSSIHALRQERIARSNGEEARAEKWRADAEKYLRDTVEANPTDALGYQYLGDYLLFVKRDQRRAVEVWNEGLQNSFGGVNEELIGRVVMLLLDQAVTVDERSLAEVHPKLEQLDRAITDMRISRTTRDRARVVDMLTLLRAQLANTEANIAASKINAARRENRIDEVNRLAGVVQRKRSEAMQEYEKVLTGFGNNPDNYVFETRSVYNTLLLPQSLIQLGDLKLDWGVPDSAAQYYEWAARFPDSQVRRMALIKRSFAYRQTAQWEQAAETLKHVVDAFPDDLALRYEYTTTLFRSQISSNSATAESLGEIKSELETLKERQNELPQPWALDIRLIHLDVARANLSGDANIILSAMDAATRKFAALESTPFPPDAEGNARNFAKYADDPAFVAELVGIYSSLSARNDFDRLIEDLRAFPNGEDAYFEARINDKLRRNNREEALVIIDEALTSGNLSNEMNERLTTLSLSMRSERVDINKTYEQLKTTFDNAPETLKPQAFFLLAELSLDKWNDIPHAKAVNERLKVVEGENGTMWKYIEVRLLLKEDDPDYESMRQIQEQIAGARPDWDRAYVLRTIIEEHYLIKNPDDPFVLDVLIANYRDATRRGNKQPEVWQRYVDVLRQVGRPEDAGAITREAALRGLILDSREGQLPQPYQRMYSDIQTEIANENASGADELARQCILLAERSGESADLLFTLHLVFGKVFLDANLYDSAKRHLRATARRGGVYVYPYALCLARDGDADGGFSLLLDEIDRVPSSMEYLLPSILVLLGQVRPGEEVFERIDLLMERIQRGDRLTLRGTLQPSEDDQLLSIGTRWMPTRQLQTIVVRFPENSDAMDDSDIQFFSPEDLEEEEE